jgi:hypothetical protein
MRTSTFASLILCAVRGDQGHGIGMVLQRPDGWLKVHLLRTVLGHRQPEF